MSEPTVVTLQIAGEDYTIRTLATPEHARACAAHVDAAMREILQASSMVQPQRAAILAALAITDELFQARGTADDVQGGLTSRIARLTAAIDAELAASSASAPASSASAPAAPSTPHAESAADQPIGVSDNLATPD